MHVFNNWPGCAIQRPDLSGATEGNLLPGLYIYIIVHNAYTYIMCIVYMYMYIYIYICIYIYMFVLIIITINILIPTAVSERQGEDALHEEEDGEGLDARLVMANRNSK